MRILQLCKKFPYPLNDGESIAVSSMSKALNALGADITLLSMNTTKHYTELSNLPEEFNFYEEIQTVSLDNELKVWDAIKNIFSSSSFHISRYVSSTFEAELKEILKKKSFDIIQLETLYLTPYIPIIKKYSKAIISMRAHNIESEIWDRITKNTRSFPKRIYLDHLTQKLKNYELTHLNDYDYLVTVSKRDLVQFKNLGYQNGAMASPIGLELQRYEQKTKDLSIDISFIGSLDWRPNEEGIIWFVKEVMPIILKDRPTCKLHIAGRNGSNAILKLRSENIIIHGEIERAVDFINRSKVMVVPLFSGSGTRVKILEGMALKKAIVSTSIGLEGIEAEDGRHLFVRDTKEEFAKAVINLLDDSNIREKIGESAFEFVSKNYNSLENAKILLNKYEELITSSAYKK